MFEALLRLTPPPPFAATRLSAIRVRVFAIAAFALVTVAPGAIAAEQTRITRPIRLIVPYVPGGGTDTAARLVQPFIAEEFGQQVVVDNRPGGSSTIGTQMVARAAPDGYTIGMVDAAFVTNPSLFDKLPYDTLKDFTPIALVVSAPMVLLVNPAVPAKSVKELVALAKAQPGALTFGTAGNGTATHIAAEQLRAAAGIDIRHIPYKGSGQSITELLGGQLTMAFTTQSTARAYTQAGRLRALAITSPKRVPRMPEVMTFAEAGFPAVDTVTITGLIAPAGMPKDYVKRLNAAVMRGLSTRDLQDKLAELGYETTNNTPEEYAARIRTEIPKWGKVIKASGARAEGR
jgi:tripartite-type tricarboxylate transporter receptor subunit TctC